LIAVFDASVLIFLFEKEALGPIDPATGLPLDRCYDRVNYLVAALTQDRAKIVIPTPSLAEILVKAGSAAPEWLRFISESRYIRVVPFDVRAAVEYAAIQQDRIGSGAKRTEPRAKAKFDDQIISIARVEGADVIYSYDEGLAKAAAPQTTVISIVDLPLPPTDPQLNMLEALQGPIETNQNDKSDGQS
jgi:predicted nucleic acid-binding protein